MMNDQFVVRWNKQKWRFHSDESASYTHSVMTYHGKVEKVYFLIKWNRHNDEYTIMWDDVTHKGTAYFTHTLGLSIQNIMADRAGISQYERYQKNYPTSKSSAPTNLYIGNARIYVVRYTDNTRWWYEANSTSRDEADWVSKLFKPDIQPSKEHLLKQVIKGDFTYDNDVSS